jgi:long-chain acyl-CoA synthetase
VSYPGEHALTHPDKPAMMMAASGRVITYRELDQRSRALAIRLYEAGLRRGDTVAVVSENRLEWAEIIWAAARSGLDIAPVNFHLGSIELRAMLDASDARLVITSRACRFGVEAVAGTLHGLREIWDVDDSLYGEFATATNDVVIDETLGGRVMFSSGTTGTPKAVRHRPVERVHPRDAVPHLGEYTDLFGLDDRSIYLSPAPTYHTAPFRFVFAVTQIGGTVVVMERFDPALALEAIGRHRVTHAQFVPTMLLRMIRLPAGERAGADLSTLQAAITSAAPCPPALKDRIDEWWGPVLHELYGASEGYGNTHIGPLEARHKRGSVGRAVRGRIHVKDRDGNALPAGTDGVIWFEGGGQDSSLGRLSTVGDVGHVDDEGYLFLTGRANQIIVCGGVNIHPREVEELLSLHAAVADVAVVGVPDPEYGEVVAAFVVVHGAAGDLTDIGDRLMEYCRDRLAHYKCPRRITVVPELPRGENGKMYMRLIELGHDERATLS